MHLDIPPLSVDEAFEALIKAAHQVIDTNFDEIAFKKWRHKAIHYIAVLLGAEHPYARSFSEHVQRRDLSSLFLGRGLVYTTKPDVLMNAGQIPVHLENS